MVYLVCSFNIYKVFKKIDYFEIILADVASQHFIDSIQFPLILWTVLYDPFKTAAPVCPSPHPGRHQVMNTRHSSRAPAIAIGRGAHNRLISYFVQQAELLSIRNTIPSLEPQCDRFFTDKYQTLLLLECQSKRPSTI